MSVGDGVGEKLIVREVEGDTEAVSDDVTDPVNDTLTVVDPDTLGDGLNGTEMDGEALADRVLDVEPEPDIDTLGDDEPEPEIDTLGDDEPDTETLDDPQGDNELDTDGEMDPEMLVVSVIDAETLGE